MRDSSPEFVELSAGSSRLVVSPAAGGSITRYLTYRAGHTYHWMRPALANAVSSRAAGSTSSFPMVPFSNRIRDAAFRFRGQTIQLPQNFSPEPHAIHGHAWRAPWEVVQQSNASLTLAYHHAADSWPWTYHTEQHFRLTERQLTIRCTVTNTSTEPMPVGFGFHPYFVRTPRVRLHAAVGRMWRADDNAMPDALVEAPGNLPFNEEGLNPDATILDNNFVDFGGQARVVWPEWNAALDMTADPIFSCLVIYTPEGRDFFCVEPATNCIDGFNLADEGREDAGLLVIEPNDTAAGDVTFAPVLTA